MGSDRLKQVEAIYRAALERTGEERERYLDEACQGDESLRAEVASLISHGAAGFPDDPMTATRPGAGPGSPPLDAGRQLNSYRIVGLLGRGGMGEVYRARDQELGREVAIKVLPAEYAADPDLASRFEREARLLAALNHPNIAAIYGVERAGDVRFLVLELVEGDTLEDLLRASAVPVETSLRLALQIAEALEAAHERGIIHRDLKPANVKITPEGKVKVLDFGLGKALAGSDTSVTETGATSLTMAATARGVIMGTPAYMSPEQARGETGDHRADIWAFGVVLYELLTGESLFARNTLTETLARVLESEPDFTALLKATPARVRRLVRRCLEKDPRRRYQHIGDVRIEIAEVLDAPQGEDEAETEAIPPASRPATLVTILASIVALASLVGLGIVWAGRDATTNRAATHLSLTLEQGLRLGGAPLDGPYQGRPVYPTFALSPDGRTLVYVGGDAESYRLYIRPLGRDRADPIPGTERAVGPFFSPDGESIGFFTADGMKRVPVRGGEVRTISTSGAEYFTGFASWTGDDRILLASYEGIRQVPASGGSVTGLTNHDRPRPFAQGGATMLPGGQAVLYSEGLLDGTDPSEWDVVVESLETGERVVVTENGSDPRYLESGHIAFARSGTIMAVGFDAERMEVRGDPVVVIEDVMHAERAVNTNMNTGVAQWSVSDSGALAYVPGGVFPEQQNYVQMYWLGLDGELEPLGIDPGQYPSPRVSPDETRLAYSEGAFTNPFDRTIWIYDIDLEIPELLESGVAGDVAWSPDSQEIVFSRRTAEGRFELFRAAADGSGTPQRVTESEGLLMPASWSRNGVLALIGNTGTARGILTLDMEGSGDLEPFLEIAAPQMHPVFSPDGNWLAYVSNETGRNEVSVRPYPETEPAYRISNDGGNSPLWSPDGERLYYLSAAEEQGAYKLMAVDVSTEPRFTRSRPRELFEVSLQVITPILGYDLAPDGERFLICRVVEREPEPITGIRVVLNWMEELKERIPVQ